MSVSPDSFRSALGRFATGVTILSARDASGRDRGMTVSAFASVSLDPPLVLACVDHAASIHGTLMSADTVGISVLTDAQEACSRRFAEPDTDRFEDAEIVRGTSGVALVAGALAHLECRVITRHEGGDHTILLAHVDRVATFEGRPLLYYRGGYAGLRD